MIYIDHENPSIYLYPREYHYIYDVVLIDLTIVDNIIRLEDRGVFEFSRGVVGINLDTDKLLPNKLYYIKVYHKNGELMYNGKGNTGAGDDIIDNNDIIRI